MKKRFLAILLVFLAFCLAFAVGAELAPVQKKDFLSSKAHFEDMKAVDLAIHALKGEIEALRANLALLEALKPSFASFMPEFSERFHVMRLAGEGGDWAVAAHELAEMRRLIKVAKSIDLTKGGLMESFLAGNLHKVNETITHGKKKAFMKALRETVESCNKCHIAVAAPYIKVALNHDDIVSMRHSHQLSSTKAGSMIPHKH